MRKNKALLLSANALREYGSKVADTLDPSPTRGVNNTVDLERITNALGITINNKPFGFSHIPTLVVQVRYNGATHENFDIKHLNLDLTMASSRRRRFAIAQALGLYYVLHVYPEGTATVKHTFDNDYRVEFDAVLPQIEYGQTKTEHERIIEQANNFAAGVLMPEDAFLAHVIKMVEKGESIDPEEVGRSLSYAFNVSPKAAQTRYEMLLENGKIKL